MLVSFAAALGAGEGSAQSRDLQAVALLQKALAKLSGDTEVRDVVLEATAMYTAGSDVETGTATLQA